MIPSPGLHTPVEVGTPCASCHGPLEKSVVKLRWCDCPLCPLCAGGVMWSCPVCGAHPPKSEDVDISVHYTDKSGDLSGWWWIVGVVVLAIGCLIVQWLIL